MSRLDELTNDDFAWALEQLQAGHVPESGGPSTGYDLLHDGGTYPPKNVLRFAYQHRHGTPLTDLNGGAPTNVPLREFGYTVVDRTELYVDPDEEMVLGYFGSDDLDTWLRGVRSRILANGAALSWWSWSSLPKRLEESGFTLLLATKGEVRGWVRVPPGGARQNERAGALPCPWPHLATADEAAQPPPGARRSDTPRAWFLADRVGRTQPTPVASFTNVKTKQAAVGRPQGFLFVTAPADLQLVSLGYEPDMDARVRHLVREIEAKWPGGIDAFLSSAPDEEQVASWSTVQKALEEPINTRRLQAAADACRPLSNPHDRGFRAPIWEHASTVADVVGQLRQLDDPTVDARDTIAAAIQALENAGYRNGSRPCRIHVARFVSVCLSALHPEHWVGSWTSQWRLMEKLLGMNRSPSDHAEAVVAAAGLARRIAATPTCRHLLGDHLLWRLEALTWQLFDQDLYQRHHITPFPLGGHVPGPGEDHRVATYRKRLQRKGQIILHGPPGTGKTWLASQIARGGDTRETVWRGRRCFVIVANPSAQDWNFDRVWAAGEVGERFTAKDRRIQSAFQRAEEGDLLFCYVAGQREITTLAEVTDALDANGERLRIGPVPGIQALPTPVPLSTIRADDLLNGSKAFSGRMQYTLSALEAVEARALADHLIRANPDLRALRGAFFTERAAPTMRTVTFHPSYAYEDFVEGIRPTLAQDAAGNPYELSDGIFKRLCHTANQHHDRDFYLVIDEINRGRIPAIFGELITLLERDKRCHLPQTDAEGMVVQLPYSREPFAVPPNLYVIGTMNTADRSVSMIDFALRRRFAFLEVGPSSAPIVAPQLPGESSEPAAAIRPWLEATGRLLEALNARVTQQRDRDHRIGHSYFLPLRRCANAADFEARADEVLREEVLPLLAEYFYESAEDLQRLVGADALDHQAVEAEDGGDTEQVFLGFKDAKLLRALAKHLGVALPAGP